MRETGKSKVIAFWLASQVYDIPGRAYAHPTRFEFAKWKMYHVYKEAKITLIIEEGSDNACYIKRRFEQDCPNVKSHSAWSNFVLK